VRQFARDCQTQAGSAVLACRAGIGLLERFEDDALFFRGNADSGVADRELDHRLRLTEHRMIAAPATRRHADVQSHAAVIGEFKRVRQQILQDLHQPLVVRSNGTTEVRVEAGAEGKLAVLGLMAEVALQRFLEVRER